MTKEKLVVEQEPAVQNIGRAVIAAEADAYKAVGERIRAAKTAMAEKFDVPEDDFCVVVSESEIERKAVLTYAAPNGLQKGSWNEIFSADEDYLVTIGNEMHDTRQGMTWEVYQGMVNGLGRGHSVDATGNDMKSDTWLTGENVVHTGVGGEMPFMASNDCGNRPELLTGYAASDRENVDEMRTFRPSIVVYSEPICLKR